MGTTPVSLFCLLDAAGSETVDRFSVFFDLYFIRFFGGRQEGLTGRGAAVYDGN